MQQATKYFTRGVFIKVDKRPRKVKNIICSWKCVDVEYKHIAFVTRSTEKKFSVGHKHRKCFTVPFPLKKIEFCDSRLASCVLDLYLLIKIWYLINY